MALTASEVLQAHKACLRYKVSYPGAVKDGDIREALEALTGDDASLVSSLLAELTPLTTATIGGSSAAIVEIVGEIKFDASNAIELQVDARDTTVQAILSVLELLDTTAITGFGVSSDPDRGW